VLAAQRLFFLAFLRKKTRPFRYWLFLPVGCLRQQQLAFEAIEFGLI
jgi:hypothetical protein